MKRNPMRGILIDPVAETIVEVWLLDGELETIYFVIDASPIDVRSVDDHNDLWIDDEALLRTPAPTKFAQWGDYPHPIAGKQLVLGNDGEGECRSTQLTIDQVTSAMRFTKREFRGITESEHDAIHPVFGRSTLFRRYADFGPEEGANPILVDSRLKALSEVKELPVTATTLDDAALFAACAGVERLPFWTLTFDAKDQPGKWCARLGFSFEPAEITQNAVVGDTQEECVGKIPLMAEGRWTFIRRMIEDQPQIVGVFL